MDDNRVQRLLHDIKALGAGELSTDRARAELDVLLVQELATIAQGTRENLYEVIANLGGEILRLKLSIESAAKSADASTARAEHLTTQLVRTQKAYTWLTAALVVATIASVAIAAMKP